MKTRIYETKRLKNGRKIVTSGTGCEFFVFGIIKFIFKAIYYLIFGIFIIPFKLFKKRK